MVRYLIAAGEDHRRHYDSDEHSGRQRVPPARCGHRESGRRCQGVPGCSGERIVPSVDRVQTSSGTTRITKPAAVAFLLAAAAGLLHAAASVYWAVGGRWQLASVGDWAVALADDRPVASGLALGVVAVMKAGAAVLPWVNERVRGPVHRQVRMCWWCAGGVLFVWGAVSTVSAAAVLAGVIVPDGGYDRAAMIGHAVVWDPLFAVWGSALLTGLWLTTHTRPLLTEPGGSRCIPTATTTSSLCPISAKERSGTHGNNHSVYVRAAWSTHSAGPCRAGCGPGSGEYELVSARVRRAQRCNDNRSARPDRALTAPKATRTAASSATAAPATEIPVWNVAAW